MDFFEWASSCGVLIMVLMPEATTYSPLPKHEVHHGEIRELGSMFSK